MTRLSSVIVAVALGAAPFGVLTTGATSAAQDGLTVHDYAVGYTFVLGKISRQAPGAPIRIHTGDSVAWTNLDPISHDHERRLRRDINIFVGENNIRELGGRAAPVPAGQEVWFIPPESGG